MALVIKQSDNIQRVDEVKNQLKSNGGYCPCRIQHTDDTKCMCKQFREQAEPGECHCGLYVKINK